jgi:hypothetical protein
MLKSLLSRSVLGGALASCVLLAGMPTAEAGPVRVRFTPPFGAPFPDLDWGGVVDIDDGGCTELGTVFNTIGGCAGNFSFTSATLTLKSLSSPSTQSIALNPSSSQVQFVQRNGLTPETFAGVFATPFAPVQGSIPATKYDGTGDGGWFSLYLLGGNNVQLYWFDRNPGSYFDNPGLYAACGKSGDNLVAQYDIRCGTSTTTALAVFQPVPEPSTYAMLAAGLGAVGFVARRRARRA